MDKGLQVMKEKDHRERARKIVESWPQWKKDWAKNMLGFYGRNGRRKD